MKKANRRGPKYPYPVPEKFQRKARHRRISQQLGRGELDWTEAIEIGKKIDKDCDFTLRLDP